MTYSFTGFIGSLQPIQQICSRHLVARNIPLGQGIYLVPLTEALQAELNGARGAELLDGFTVLTASIDQELARVSLLGPVAYAEVLRWAGGGSEAGAIWQEGQRIRTIRFGQGVLNTLLRYLGCTPAAGQDEFRTLGFGQRRFTEDWLSE